MNAESVPITSLHARADAHAAPRRAAGTGSAPGTAPAAALDLDARGLDVALLIPVIELNVVGAVTALALDRSGVEFTSVLEFGLAFVSFSDLLRRAPVVLRIRVQRLDVLLLDARFPLAVIICVWTNR